MPRHTDSSSEVSSAKSTGKPSRDRKIRVARRTAPGRWTVDYCLTQLSDNPDDRAAIASIRAVLLASVVDSLWAADVLR